MSEGEKIDLANHAKVNAAQILVVDDNLLNRKKLTRAVINLGYRAQAVDSGKAALDTLKDTPPDAILLDIIMPGMNGFEVLRIIKSDPTLRDIPIIVISALGDETLSAVKAIELGAEDFLPKDFDLVILQARLSNGLTKKVYRDQEKEYYQKIEKLTQAASKLESGVFNPDKLELDEIASQNNPLGRLATVFREMAGEIFERERKAQQTINILKASLMLLAMGAIYGLFPSVGRMAANLGANSMGLVVWMSFIGAIIALSIAAYQGNLPRLSWRDLAFFIVWAILVGVIQRTTIFIASAHIEAAILSLILAMQGFMVFGFAAVLRMEKASFRRLVGLAIGLVGVAIALGDKMGSSGKGQMIWFIFAIVPVLCLAVEVLFIAKYKPAHVDNIAALGLMMLFTALILTPVAYKHDKLITLSWQPGQLEILIAILVFIAIASNMIALYVIKTAGSVFYSQSSYLITIAGIIWGMLLLNEELSMLVWVAFAIIIFGMYLVNPKSNDTELIIKRNFSGNTSPPMPQDGNTATQKLKAG